MQSSADLSKISEGDMLSFSSGKTIQELQAENDRLKIEIKELRNEIIGQNCFGVALRAVAQVYFSCDDNARRCASNNGEFASEEVAQLHWRLHGGPEQFHKDFPTPRHVMSHFLMAHSVRRRMHNLTRKG